jgi:hypothetical protein
LSRPSSAARKRGHQKLFLDGRVKPGHGEKKKGPVFSPGLFFLRFSVV